MSNKNKSRLPVANTYIYYVLYNLTIIRPFSVFINFNKSQNPFSKALSDIIRPVIPHTSARVEAVLGVRIRANSGCPHGLHNQCRAWEANKSRKQTNQHAHKTYNALVLLGTYFLITSERSSLYFCLGNSGFIPVLLFHQVGALQSDKRVQFHCFHNSSVMSFLYLYNLPKPGKVQWDTLPMENLS